MITDGDWFWIMLIGLGILYALYFILKPEKKIIYTPSRYGKRERNTNIKVKRES
jgi:hypothetical protein